LIKTKTDFENNIKEIFQKGRSPAISVNRKYQNKKGRSPDIFVKGA